MPSDSSSDRPGWRRGSKPSGGARPVGQKAGRWTQKKDRSYNRDRSRYRAKLAIWSLLLLGLIGTLVWAVWGSYAKTPILVAVVTEYDLPIPPNAWADEDHELLKRLGKDADESEFRIVDYTKIEGKSSRRILGNLLDKFKNVRAGGPKRDVIIIYLSMHGIVNDDNEPCLLPPGATPSETDAWLKMSDLLDGLEESREGVKTLLVLDANRIDANWSLGVLYNGFADCLMEIVTEDKYPNLFVINSTSPGQIGWAAPQLRGSVFCHFLWRALSGEAADDISDDDEVSLYELRDYLQKRVNHWADVYRDDQQIPMLLPVDVGNHPLVSAKSLEEPPHKFLREHVQQRQDYRDLQAEVDKRWQEHENLQRELDPHRVDPVRWEEFQHRLLRLEQLADAGKAYQSRFKDTAIEVDRLAQVLREAAADSRLVAHSLPMAERFCGWKSDPTEINAAQKALDALLKPPAVADEINNGPEESADGDSEDANSENSAETTGSAESPEHEDELQRDSPAEGPAERPEPGPGPEFGRLAATQVVWNWAQAAEITQEDTLRLLEPFDRDNGPGTIELHFLRMLGMHLGSQVWKDDLPSVQKAIEARAKAEIAAAPRDPRTHYWIRHLVDQADIHRRRAEDGLFIGDELSLRDATTAWNEIVKQTKADGSGTTYDDAIEIAETLAAAFETRDKALARTPYLAQWLLSRLWKDAEYDANGKRELRKRLCKLINDTHQLDQALNAKSEKLPGVEPARPTAGVDAPADSQQSIGLPADLRQKQKDVQDGLLALEGALADEYLDLRGEIAKHKVGLRRIMGVLAVPPISSHVPDGPRITAEDRNGLRRDYLKRVQPIESVDPGKVVPGPNHLLTRLSRWPEHPVSAILRLAREGSNAHGALLLPEEEPPSADRDHRKRLADEGSRVRQWLCGIEEDNQQQLKGTATGLVENTIRRLDGEPEDLPREDTEHELISQRIMSGPRAGCARAARLVRASAALCGRRPWGEDERDPIAELRDLDLHYLMLWQADRTLEDFWGPRRRGEAPFFATAAGSYLGSADNLIRELCIDSSSLQNTSGRLSELNTHPYHPPLTPAPPMKPLPIDEQQEIVTQDIAVYVPERLADKLPPGRAAFYLKETWKSGRLLPMCGDIHRKSVSVSSEPPAVITCSIDNSDYLRDTAALRAVTLYRGHTGDCLCRFPPAKGFDIDYQPADYASSEITVSEQPGPPASVVFVFDCSRSMSTHWGGNESNPTRIDVARDALDYILDKLLTRKGAFRVGVMIYGRRAEWDKQYYNETKKARILYRTSPKVHPCVDVEWLFKPDTLTAAAKSKISRELLASEPGGSTPLCLAIIKAMREERKQGEKRHVVVITDGLNDQYVPMVNLTAEERAEVRMPTKVRIGNKLESPRRKLGDVELELRKDDNKDIRLDVLGFALRENWPEEERATYAQEYNELLDFLRKPGRGFGYAQTAKGLQAVLLRCLVPRRYRVLSSPGTVDVAGPAELGTTSRIPRTQGKPRQYQVHLVDLLQKIGSLTVLARNTVKFEGGEGPRLHFDKALHHLVFQHVPQPDNWCGDPIAAHSPNRDEAFLVQAHPPKRDLQNRVRFDVSIWNQDNRIFTPLPKEIWMEVTPVLPDGSVAAPPRTIYDRNCEPRQPVPQLSYLDPNWPKEAEMAQIRLWFKFQPTPETDVESKGVKELVQKTEEKQPWSSGNVTFEVKIKQAEQPRDPCRVEIVEQHPEEGRLDYLKVEMDPAPMKVTHRFIPEARRVRHTFFYEAADRSRVDTYNVRFTAGEKAKAKAFSLKRPLKFLVP